MKKFVSVLLLLVLLASSACAETTKQSLMSWVKQTIGPDELYYDTTVSSVKVDTAYTIDENKKMVGTDATFTIVLDRTAMNSQAMTEKMFDIMANNLAVNIDRNYNLTVALILHLRSTYLSKNGQYFTVTYKYRLNSYGNLYQFDRSIWYTAKDAFGF